MVGFERIYGHCADLLRAILARMSDPNKLPLQRVSVLLTRNRMMRTDGPAWRRARRGWRRLCRRDVGYAPNDGVKEFCELRAEGVLRSSPVKYPRNLVGPEFREAPRRKPVGEALPSRGVGLRCCALRPE
jgi:hypothetical protein